MLHAWSTHCARAITRPLDEKTREFTDTSPCHMHHASESPSNFRMSFLQRHGEVEARTSFEQLGANVPERRPAMPEAPRSKAEVAPPYVEHAGPSIQATLSVDQVTHCSTTTLPSRGEKECDGSCGGRAKPTR